VVHRKGPKHSNVDVLSRPVLLVQTRSGTKNIEHSDAIEKELDPYDDTTLMHFLRYGSHKAGISKKQCKRINKLAEKYVFKDDKLWYRKDDNECQKLLEVPIKEERLALVEKAHLLGHFQANTTLSRLRKKYFWKKMQNDVEQVINNCLPCKRHQDKRIMDHPAKALPITGMLDRVGMDLVFGLPETSSGYKGILVITEYLSKYPYAVPIRSKTAEEMAEKLFIYISLFGPPKELLSDQGKEFLNQIIENLSKIAGIERRVTSPYNPRTNGLTEKFNHTLVNALRKHAEEDPLNWPSWLPYVLLAYRCRIHTITGQTPFFLMFGREMNEFKTWTVEKTEIEDLELYNRSTEIRQLVQEVHPKTIEKLVTTQETQRTNQDKTKNIAGRIKTGTKIPWALYSKKIN